MPIPNNLPFEPPAGSSSPTPVAPPSVPASSPPPRPSPIAPPPAMRPEPMINVPPRPPVAPPSAQKGEPEDIFSNLDQPAKPPVRPVAPPIMQPAASGSSLKYVWIALVIVAIFGLGGFAFWFFAIRPVAPPVPISTTSLVTPTSTVATEETPSSALSNETLPVMPSEATSSLETSVPSAAVTSSSETPAPLVLEPPVTTPPPGANVPPPVSIVEPPVDPNRDTDADGLTDQRESELGTDPAKADTDGDEVNDGDEVLKFGTNPLVADTDGDGYSDGMEIGKGYNPRGPGKCVKPGCLL